MSYSQKILLGAIGSVVVAVMVIAALYPPQGRIDGPEVAAGIEMSTDAGGLPAMDTITEMGPKVVHGAVTHPAVDSAASEITEIGTVDSRQGAFFKAVLPLVLQVNQEILDDRKRLWELQYRVRLGEHLNPVDRLWLMTLAERYGLGNQELDELAERVDIVPPSLALAQAAEESDWGTAVSVRQRNALFGYLLPAGMVGLTPQERTVGDGDPVPRFASRLDSVRAYMSTLNTQPAYRNFRDARARIRRLGQVVSGASLAAYLPTFSERGAAYVGSLKAIIEGNRLGRLDDRSPDLVGSADDPSS